MTSDVARLRDDVRVLDSDAKGLTGKVSELSIKVEVIDAQVNNLDAKVSNFGHKDCRLGREMGNYRTYDTSHPAPTKKQGRLSSLPQIISPKDAGIKYLQAAALEHRYLLAEYLDA